MSFARPKGNPQALKKFSSPAKPITKHSPKPQIQQQPERCINFPNSSYQGLSGLYRFKEQVDLCYAKINPDDFTKLYAYLDPPQCLKSALICLHILFDTSINYNQVVHWQHIQPYKHQHQLLKLIGDYEQMVQQQHFDKFQLLMAKNQLLKYILVYQNDSQVAQRISKNLVFTLENLVRLSEFLIAYIEMFDQVVKVPSNVETQQFSSIITDSCNRTSLLSPKTEELVLTSYRSDSRKRLQGIFSGTKASLSQQNNELYTKKTPKKPNKIQRVNYQSSKLTTKKDWIPSGNPITIKNVQNLNRSQKKYVYEGKIERQPKPAQQPYAIQKPKGYVPYLNHSRADQICHTASEIESRSRTTSQTNKPQVDLRFLTQNAHIKYAELQRMRCATDFKQKPDTNRKARSSTIQQILQSSHSSTPNKLPDSKERHPLDHYILQQKRTRDVKQPPPSQATSVSATPIPKQTETVYSKPRLTKTKQNSSQETMPIVKKDRSGSNLKQPKPLPATNTYTKKQSLRGINAVKKDSPQKTEVRNEFESSSSELPVSAVYHKPILQQAESYHNSPKPTSPRIGEPGFKPLDSPKRASVAANDFLKKTSPRVGEPGLKPLDSPKRASVASNDFKPLDSPLRASEHYSPKPTSPRTEPGLIDSPKRASVQANDFPKPTSPRIGEPSLKPLDSPKRVRDSPRQTQFESVPKLNTPRSTPRSTASPKQQSLTPKDSTVPSKVAEFTQSPKIKPPPLILEPTLHTQEVIDSPAQPLLVSEVSDDSVPNLMVSEVVWQPDSELPQFATQAVNILNCQSVIYKPPEPDLSKQSESDVQQAPSNPDVVEALVGSTVESDKAIVRRLTGQLERPIDIQQPQDEPVKQDAPREKRESQLAVSHPRQAILPVQPEVQDVPLVEPVPEPVKKQSVTRVSNKIAVISYHPNQKQMQQMLNLGNIFGNAAANQAPKKKNEFEENRNSTTTEIQMGRATMQNVKRKMRTLNIIASLLDEFNN